MVGPGGLEAPGAGNKGLGLGLGTSLSLLVHCSLTLQSLHHHDRSCRAYNFRSPLAVSCKIRPSFANPFQMRIVVTQSLRDSFTGHRSHSTSALVSAPCLRRPY